MRKLTSVFLNEDGKRGEFKLVSKVHDSSSSNMGEQYISISTNLFEVDMRWDDENYVIRKIYFSVGGSVYFSFMYDVNPEIYIPFDFKKLPYVNHHQITLLLEDPNFFMENLEKLTS